MPIVINCDTLDEALSIPLGTMLRADAVLIGGKPLQAKAAVLPPQRIAFKPHYLDLIEDGSVTATIRPKERDGRTFVVGQKVLLTDGDRDIRAVVTHVHESSLRAAVKIGSPPDMHTTAAAAFTLSHLYGGKPVTADSMVQVVSFKKL